MPRKALWFLAAALIVLFLILGRIGRLRGRVVIVNQSGTTITDVAASNERFAQIGNGESRAVWQESGEDVVVAFHFRERVVRWRSPSPLAAGDSVVIVVHDNGAIETRHGLTGSR